MKKLILGFALVMLGACGSGVGQEPPADELFFPVDVAIDPDSTRLYVSNSNFNARFNGGTVVVLDLLQLEADGLACRAAQDNGTAAPPNCQIRVLTPPTLCEIDTATGLCSEIDRKISQLDEGATVKIASFPGDFVLSPVQNRFFIPVRGDQSLTLIDFDSTVSGDAALSCEEVVVSPGTPGRCAGQHVLLSDRDESLVEFGTIILNFIDGLFDIALDFGREIPGAGSVNLAYVSHVDAASMSLFRVSPQGEMIFQESVFLGGSGGFGLGSMKIHPQTGIAYVARVSNPPQAFGTSLRLLRTTIAEDDPARLELISAGEIVTAAVNGGLAGGASDLRALAFGQGGERLYVGAATPSSILIFDTSLNEFGEPKNSFLGRIDTDAIPEKIEVVSFEDGTELIYVTDFADAALHIINPLFIDGSVARNRIRLGLSPLGTAFGEVNGARRLFVANFNEDTISVIDLEPESPTFHEVLYRIGGPRPIEEE